MIEHPCPLFTLARYAPVGARPLMWLVAVDTDRQMVLTHEACSSDPYNGSAMLRPLVDAVQAATPLGIVLADVEFDSEYNHRHARDQLPAASVIPAKRCGGLLPMVPEVSVNRHVFWTRRPIWIRCRRRAFRSAL